jgi:hypothetical protein
MKDKAIQCWLLLIVLILLSSLFCYCCSKNMQEESVLTSYEVDFIQESLQAQDAEDCTLSRTAKGWQCKSNNKIYFIEED